MPGFSSSMYGGSVVHHGKYFTPPDKAQRLDVPTTQGSNTPVPNSKASLTTASSGTNRSDLDSITSAPSTLEGIVGKLTGLTGLSSVAGLEDLVKKAEIKETPFWCYGFLFEGKVLYFSDTSFIPTRTWNKLYKAVGGGEIGENSTAGPQPRLLPFSAEEPDLPAGKIETFILDCLRISDHPSHLSYVQALSLAMKTKAKETYLVGFTHPDRHALWEDVGHVVQGQAKELGTKSTDDRVDEDEDELDVAKKEFRDKIEQSARDQELEHVWRQALEWKGLVQPAFDRQVIRCD